VKNVTAINTLKSKIRKPMGTKTVSIESPEKRAISNITKAGNSGIKKFNLLKSDLYFMNCFAVF
jgi:hypothetical protein